MSSTARWPSSAARRCRPPASNFVDCGDYNVLGVPGPAQQRVQGCRVNDEQRCTPVFPRSACQRTLASTSISSTPCGMLLRGTAPATSGALLLPAGARARHSSRMSVVRAAASAEGASSSGSPPVTTYSPGSKLQRTLMQLNTPRGGDGSRFKVMQWNILADGLAQNGDFVRVRGEQGVRGSVRVFGDGEMLLWPCRRGCLAPSACRSGSGHRDSRAHLLLWL